MIEAIVKSVVGELGVSGVFVIGLSAALYRLAQAYIAARDRTEALLKEFEASNRRTTKEVLNALHASTASIDALRGAIVSVLGSDQ